MLLVLIITQFLDQVKISSTLQLIKGISRVLQKLLKYSSGTIISTFSIFTSLSVLPIIFNLKLNESVSLAPSKITISPSLFTAGTSLQYCHKLPDVLNNYRYILLSCTLALLYQCILHCQFGYYLFCLCS